TPEFRLRNLGFTLPPPTYSTFHLPENMITCSESWTVIWRLAGLYLPENQVITRYLNVRTTCTVIMRFASRDHRKRFRGLVVIPGCIAIASACVAGQRPS